MIVIEPKTSFDLSKSALNILRQKSDFRVWSVIVSVFGDLARGRTDRISGAVLSKLCQHLEIKPEAMRVALHRLRKDGWIVSEKSGRTSDYKLSARGFDESLAARGQIYARNIDRPKNWSLHIAAPMNSGKRQKHDQDMAAKGAFVVVPGVYLAAACTKIDHSLNITGTLSDLPDWISQVTAPDKLTAEYGDLSQALAQVIRLLETAPPLTDLEIAALRVLIIHRWRKLVLRHTALPADFYPVGWPGLTCRAQVATLLERLERPSLANLHI